MQKSKKEFAQPPEFNLSLAAGIPQRSLVDECRRKLNKCILAGFSFSMAAGVGLMQSSRSLAEVHQQELKRRLDAEATRLYKITHLICLCDILRKMIAEKEAHA